MINMPITGYASPEKHFGSLTARRVMSSYQTKSPPNWTRRSQGLYF